MINLRQNVFFALQEACKQHPTFRIYRQLLRSQKSSLDEIKQIQAANLHVFLSDVFSNVPYYAKMQQRIGVSLENIKHAADLSCLPFLDKSIIKSNMTDLSTIRDLKCKVYRTGGSTGEPLTLKVGLERIGHDIAAKMRARTWWNIHIGSKEWVIWGAPQECAQHSLIKRWRDKLLNTTLVPARDLDERHVCLLLTQLCQEQPLCIVSYPSVLGYFADIARKYGIPLQSAQLKVAFVTSEVLDHAVKDSIEEIFSCPVANEYGGRDFGFVAHSCPAGNMHISSEDIIVEIVDPYGKTLGTDQVGEIVITNLRTASFPMIRYRTGDMAAVSEQPCSCGMGLPVLTHLQGRTSDLLVSTSGGVIHRAELVGRINRVQDFSRFQFVQKSKIEGVLRVQTNHLNVDTTAHLEREIIALFGPQFQVTITQCEHIPTSPSGKFKFIINEMHGASCVNG